MIRRSSLAAGILIFLASIFLAATFTKLSHTVDEPAHLAAGMQWIEEGRYDLDPLHPPLARVMMAALPYIDGLRLQGEGDFWQKGWATLFADGGYIQHLWLMRMGVLPLYILSCALVFLWSRELFGAKAGLLSLGLYLTLPPVAAHAGLATTDMACSAFLMAGLMTTLRWLRRPGWNASIWTGMVLGLMAMAKFSTLFFWPAAMAGIFILGLAGREFSIRRRHFLTAPAVMTTALLVIWSMNFFSFDPVVKGILQLLHKDRVGHAPWLFGPLRNQGVWYFFPALYLIKTPLAFLGLSLAGLAVMPWQARQRKVRVRALFPVVAALSVLGVAMTSNINLGLRHVLPIYALLSIPAGYVLLLAWKKGVAARALIGGLLLLQAYEMVTTYPDRLIYFNNIAVVMSKDRPERIANGSDLEWGQSYLRMVEALKQKGVTEFYYCRYRSRYHPYLQEMTGINALPCADAGKKPGWLVVERHPRAVSRQQRQWLEGLSPEQVGGLDLYHIQP